MSGKEVDMLLAQFFGWKDVVEADFGGIAGINPVTKRLENIPRPSESLEDLYSLVQMCLYMGIELAMAQLDDHDYMEVRIRSSNTWETLYSGYGEMLDILPSALLAHLEENERRKDANRDTASEAVAV